MQFSAVALLAAAGLALFPADRASAATRTAEPEFVAPDISDVPKGTRVDVIADRMTYDGRTEIATATGTVRLTYGPYVLTATRVAYDMKKGLFTANGSIQLREPNGNVLEADFAELKDTFKEGFANHVRALLTNDVTITARYARRFENGITIYEDATYTACKACVDEGGTPLWQIVSRETKHDLKERTLYYRSARLEIGGVPVVWTPYFSYPDPTVKRRTGFLLPSFHGGGAYGVGVTTPYFYEVAPNKDFTISPMWNTRQGVLGDLEWRHRLTSGSYKVRAYGIHELDPDPQRKNEPWRGAAETHGRFDLSSTWNWGWDGTLASDREFLSDYDISSDSILKSSVHTTRLSGRSYANAQAIHFQTQEQGESQDLMPVLLPFVTANYIFDRPVLGGELGIDMNAYSLRRIDPDTRFTLGTEQTHAVTRLKWRREMTGAAGVLFTPFGEVRSDLYISEDVPGAGGQEAETHFLPSAGFDLRWPLLADHGVAQGVMTPVLQIIASPSERSTVNRGNEDAITLNFDSTSLFLSDRFTGFDRYEGGVRANAGLTYTLLGENGGFLRASIGESFHIAGDNSFVAGSGLEGTSSDLVGAIALQLNESVTLGYQARMEEDLSRINVQEASLGLTFDRISGSLSYADIAAAANYGRPTAEEQLWGAANVMLSDAWSLFGSFRFDIEDNHFMERTIGLAFTCDCMNAQLAYSQNRDDKGDIEHKVNLSVELRTIGEVDGGFGF